MKKRMAALLGALTLGLGLLAGCTNTAGAGASAGGSGLPNAANGTLDPNDPITITFYSYNLSNPRQAETMQAIIDGFNETVGKEKGIIVEGVADEVTGNLTKTKADIQAGNQVNIIQHTFPTLDSSRLNLGIQAYEDIFPADEMEEHFAGIDGGARQLGVIDGKTYGIAFTFSTPVMYINADLLREAGLDPETDAPKTWDEMLTVCRTIKETTGKYGLCLPATATNSWITESLIFSNGGTMLSEDRTEATFATEETVEAFTIWKQHYDEGLCAPGTDTDEAIIRSIDFGLYAKKMGGGSVNPVTGEFNFAVNEGYLVRNGQICEPVRGASLIGKGSEVIRNIDMVGMNLRREQGVCGASNGSVPTDVGQPMIRVSEITVGGRK